MLGLCVAALSTHKNVMLGQCVAVLCTHNVMLGLNVHILQTQGYHVISEHPRYHVKSEHTHFSQKKTISC